MSKQSIYFNKMQTIIKKWGNSLALRIPVSITRETGLSDGSVVNIQMVEDSIVIKPVKKVYVLEDLLSQVNDSNIHKETNTGDPVGREIW